MIMSNDPIIISFAAKLLSNDFMRKTAHTPFIKFQMIQRCQRYEARSPLMNLISH